MSKKRVVVTGLGVVSCLGHDPETFYQNLLAGKSGAKKIQAFPTDEFSTQIAAEITDFDPGEYIDKKQARRYDKFISYAMVAGKKAFEQAKLKKDQLEQKRCGIIIGSGMGGMSVFADGVDTLNEKGPRRVTPFLIPMIITNMASGLLAMDLGFMGPNYSISTACATATHSIVLAGNHIKNGEADVMICGGTEAAITPIGLAGFCSCKALSKRNDEPEKASRPWDGQRDGFLMGEGAGVLVLESLEHALKRGAPILAEYLGGAVTCDAHHMTEPRSDGEGVAECIRLALEDADTDPSAVNYINAHATSTPAGDMVEVEAVKKVFTAPKNITMNATKSMIGHSLGAAGGIEAVATIQAIQTKKVHPTINLTTPAEGLDFNIPTKAEDIDINVALSNSFGFGGHNASIVFAPYHE